MTSVNNAIRRPAHVTGDLDVVRVLLERRAARSVPGARRDPHQIALVVGGGGMRGAYVAGMLRALEREGLRDAFDEAYASSSGAASAAAFLTGSADSGAACFPEDLASRRFIDTRRLVAPGPVVSLDYFIDKVLGVRKPLRWEALVDSPAPLRVVATDVDDLTAWELYPQTVPDWKLAIRASATIPLSAGRAVPFAGHRWVDGSVAEPLATARALAGGATHVLVMLCRGEGELDPRPIAALPWWNRLADRLVPGLGTLAQGTRRYTAELAIIDNHITGGAPRGEHLLAIAAPRG
ncbi:patatin-like phospholipase family protein [Sporichthya sp.]|uniref:patatin-like phospholipase family protein n=1 Tax=Sporichthya sp. TaxID=65475 RepID=UPI001800FBD6|nr:patatin-like phospholipase family protein [Sporichthya sp.]MBA3741894.1 patatin-like phospholipase family protein [Sporichthya sp.]